MLLEILVRDKNHKCEFIFLIFLTDENICLFDYSFMDIPSYSVMSGKMLQKMWRLPTVSKMLVSVLWMEETTLEDIDSIHFPPQIRLV